MKIPKFYLILGVISLVLVAGGTFLYLFLQKDGVDVDNDLRTKTSHIPEGWASVSRYPFGQKVTVVYPQTYQRSESSQPINIDSEGGSTSTRIDCTPEAGCTPNSTDYFVVTVYENRKGYDLASWVVKSVYAPQHDCKPEDKDPNAKIIQSLYNGKEVYSFRYKTYEQYTLGCRGRGSLDQEGDGAIIYRVEGSHIVAVASFSSTDKTKADLEQMEKYVSFE